MQYVHCLSTLLLRMSLGTRCVVRQHDYVRVYGTGRSLGFAFLWKRRDDVAYLVSAFGSPLTSHIDVTARVRFRFGEVKWILVLVTGIFPCCPGRRGAGQRFASKINVRYHPSSESRTGAIWANIVQDERALVFKYSSVSNIRGSYVSPLGTVEGRKLRIIHNLTFARHGYRLSVNGDTDLSAAPPSELGHFFEDVCRRILSLPSAMARSPASCCAVLMPKTCCARFSLTPCVLLTLVTFSASAPPWTGS